ncbi:DUF3575 domain-containing protein [Polaribacter cellanae]|uniref:DUF3575 domain-containing protein n=1 Tax=Polaribacter cellanae TaxID=2818493 RepID=A0A975H5T3_9FLAO|nr:DUF3575 domain-containing protein [Polaribacter cellanae]QTE21736.1 DUF3575 domain-containing protein [Polaribacter cellanae]
MRKYILIFLLLVTTFTSIAQEKEKEGVYPQDIAKKTEVKINVLTLLAGKWIDVSYENLINEESSFGIAATINTDTNKTNLKYSLTPYYRRYFSEKFARGFFVEGFGMLFSAKDRAFSNDTRNSEFETGFGVGVSVGGKFVSKRGFTTELLLGVGRNLGKSENNSVIGRLGISVGYRF